MNTIEVTFARALKVWWSFAWRTFVLWIPLGLVMAVSMFWVLPFPRPGQAHGPLMPGQMPVLMHRGFLLWLIVMAVSVTVQTVAMRWMLKTRWSDFRLLAVSNEADV